MCGWSRLRSVSLSGSFWGLPAEIVVRGIRVTTPRLATPVVLGQIAAADPPAVVGKTEGGVVAVQVFDISAVGGDDHLELGATSVGRPRGGVRDEQRANASAPELRGNVKVFEFGDQPVLQPEAGGRHGERDRGTTGWVGDQSNPRRVGGDQRLQVAGQRVRRRRPKPAELGPSRRRS